MKKFESFIAPKLEEYIRHRKSFGYNEQNLRSNLRSFDRYLLGKEITWHSFKPKFFLEFRNKLRGKPTTINGVLSGTRNFFQFLADSRFLPHNPLRDIPPCPVGEYFPYIFSMKQIAELLNIVKSKYSTTSNYPYQRSIYIAILLMARCGLRISEPLKLLEKHYHQNEKTIYIEKTKFNNARLIPLPESVALEVDNYLCVKKKSFYTEQKNNNLIVGKNNKPLSITQIYNTFHQSVKDIGINSSKQQIKNITFGSPTPHSLRHSFAVNTLNRIRDREETTWDLLPILSIYMGHQNVCSTIKYLTVPNFKFRQNLLDFIILNQEQL